MNHQPSRPITDTAPVTARTAPAAVIPWDGLARLLLFGLFVLALLTFRDYSISIDEEVQHIYGKKLLSYYLSGFTDKSAFVFKDLFYYGGLFDLTVASLLPISPFSEYDTRHLLCALVGVLGVGGTWRLARLMAGPRAGFIAAVLLTLSGVYYGAMFNNTKDVPFAAGTVWSLYFATRILDQLPRPRLSAVLKFGVVFGMTLAIRVGGVLVAGYLGLALLAAWAVVWRNEGRTRALSDAGRGIVALLPSIPVALGVMALFWPWVVQEPGNILKAVQTFSHFPLNIETLFNGQLVQAKSPPALYLPVYLLIKLPEVVLAGLLIAMGIGVSWLVWRPCYYTCGWQSTVRKLPTILAAILPVVLFMLMRPTVYNGVRHFLFTVPPLVVFAAIGLDGAWRMAERAGARIAQAFTAAAVGVCVVGGWHLGAMHPNEYVYFNSLVGGTRGAEGRFELDYWGNSVLESVKQLEAFIEMENGGHPPERTYTLVVCGNALAARYELPPWLKLVNGIEPLWREADFFIAFTQDRICPTLLDGHPILEVTADDVPLSIVRDRRPKEPDDQPEQPEQPDQPSR